MRGLDGIGKGCPALRDFFLDLTETEVAPWLDARWQTGNTSGLGTPRSPDREKLLLCSDSEPTDDNSARGSESES